MATPVVEKSGLASKNGAAADISTSFCSRVTEGEPTGLFVTYIGNTVVGQVDGEEEEEEEFTQDLKR